MRKINVYSAAVKGEFGSTAENFGDNLMHFMLPELFNVQVRYVHHSKADLIGVGSIIDSYWRRRRNGHAKFWQKRPWRTLSVWGSGFMSSHSIDLWPQKLRYHAVRGPLSAARVPDGDKIALGDPAILLPKIWVGPTVKEREVLVIPHFASYESFSSHYQNQLPKHWKIVDLRSDPKHVCEQIAASEFVITSSLHGLIVADAYGVPSCRVNPIKEIKGDGFKYRDYEQQRGQRLAGPFDFEQILRGPLDFSSDEFRPIVPSDEVVESLISAFPYR
ncbi:polysaccharide pyruvyl transferase family protein [Agrobacterium vaccinii]|uniref:polysaccharide pyruvyl transferase family protein n=1 Tax=Agrobacterium vaccinii TaxID=2735528 RepID=UPI001E4C3DA9|nr:polysaccharide pyruvyl transferase family protein [Agrobacterium vaccinii]UHS61065.1 polysaccharide pyruvyl transferase family protein [Agrobacterium vaccinii]